MPSFASNETTLQLWQYKAALVGSNLGSWSNGILVSVTILCFIELVKRRAHVSRMRNMFYFGYVFLLSSLGTVGSAFRTFKNQKTFVDGCTFLGGGDLNEKSSYNSNPEIIACACLAISTWLQDGFLLYRFIMFYRFNYYISILPFLMYLGSITTSLILISDLISTDTSIISTEELRFGTAFWSLSVSLNILLTILIVGRILWLRSGIIKVLGEEFGKKYTTVVAMLAESAALYSITGLVFIICYSLNSPASGLFVGLLGQFQCVSPILIIYRVSRGSSLSRETIDLAITNSIRFAFPSSSYAMPGSAVRHDTVVPKRQESVTAVT